MEQTISKRPHPALQLAILFGLVAICLVICLYLVKFALPPLFHIADPDAFITSVSLQKEHTYAALFMQSLASTWGMFLLPAFIFSKVMNYNVGDFFKLNRFPSAFEIGLAFIVIVSGVFFTNLLVDINKHIPLPSWLSSLRNTQTNANELIASFFSQKSTAHFLVLALVLAALPAFAEELFFRGVIQNMLQKSGLGIIGAIVITGFSFSMMHLEFDNFLAIWVMGIVLGWLYYFTQNLWVSIFAHFVNNLSVIVLKYGFYIGFLKEDFSETVSPPLFITLPAGVLIAVSLWWLRKRYMNNQTEELA